MYGPTYKIGNHKRGSVVRRVAFFTFSFAISLKYPKRHAVTGAQAQSLN